MIPSASPIPQLRRPSYRKLGTLPRSTNSEWESHRSKPSSLAPVSKLCFLFLYFILIAQLEIDGHVYRIKKENPQIHSHNRKFNMRVSVSN